MRIDYREQKFLPAAGRMAMNFVNEHGTYKASWIAHTKFHSGNS